MPTQNVRVQGTAACGRVAVLLAAIAGAPAIAPAIAQEPPVYPGPPAPPPQEYVAPQPDPSAEAYPVPQTYPAPQDYAASPAYVPPSAHQTTPLAPRRTSLRDVFAGTLATLVQVTGANALVSLTNAIGGGIAHWFGSDARRATTPGFAPAPAPQFAGAPTYAPDTTAYAAPSQEPATYPAPAYAPESGTSAAPPAQFYDPQTGASVVPGADPPVAASGEIYAGLAYEVHVLAANGATSPVDPANHTFRTGERFVLLYRPTLPGRVEVYNVNPMGRESLIDTADVAAAQLARLGPYEFTATTGDEQLRLVLVPCSTPGLLLQTRDIVRVDAGVGDAGAPNLQSCTPGATRSIRAPRTRDIRKVGIEGSTSFALDPVAPQELASGQMAPRAIRIAFRHR